MHVSKFTIKLPLVKLSLVAQFSSSTRLPQYTCSTSSCPTSMPNLSDESAEMSHSHGENPVGQSFYCYSEFSLRVRMKSVLIHGPQA